MNGYRIFAGWLLLGLLSGYLIFNRAFAQLGFPPLYIGEIVIAVCLVSAVANWRDAFLLPLQRSWIFRLIAAFMIFGFLRIAWDARTHGIMAVRDGVICIYAIVAFLAPFILQERSKRIDSILIPVSLVALFFVAAFQFHWISTSEWQSIKPDFLAVAAAVALWLGFVQMVAEVLSACKPLRVPRPAFFLALATSICAGMLVYDLPARAIWLAPPLLVLMHVTLIFSAAGRKPWRNWRATLLVMIALSLLAFGVHQSTEAFRQRVRGMFSADSSQFATRSGKRSAESVQWRKIFWRNTIEETIKRAPVCGAGFGTNLTDLLRDKPEWPIFEESQRLNPPNRHPHSAHVSVFARLGAIGLALWVAILIGVAGSGFQNCRNAMSRFWNARDSERRTKLHDFANSFFIYGVWIIYVIAMTFGVVLENPFGGIWFWAMTGMIASDAVRLKYGNSPRNSNINDNDPGEEETEEAPKRSAENSVDML